MICQYKVLEIPYNPSSLFNIGTAVRLPAAAGVLTALEAKRDALAKRTEGLIRCKQEFQELARCL